MTVRRTEPPKSSKTRKIYEYVSASAHPAGRETVPQIFALGNAPNALLARCLDEAAMAEKNSAQAVTEWHAAQSESNSSFWSSSSPPADVSNPLRSYFVRPMFLCLR